MDNLLESRETISNRGQRRSCSLPEREANKMIFSSHVKSVGRRHRIAHLVSCSRAAEEPLFNVAVFP